MGEVERFQPEDIETTWRRAKGYALSGYFQDAKSAEQAFVKISAGAEMGLTPFQSMTGIHIISGKPVVGAGLLASMLDQDPDYDYTVSWEPDAANATACTVSVLKGGKVRGESRFSLEDAQRAGLTQPNWKKFPPNMLFARAMSNAVRWYAPGVTGTSVYVEGEIPTFEGPRVEHADPKPRTRVTAEVIPDEVVTPTEVEVEPDSYNLSALLKGMNAFDRAELYTTVGIERGTKTPDVLLILRAELDKLNMPDDPQPDPRQILALHRRNKANQGSAEAFELMLNTGQDVDPGDQVEFDEVMS